ncbi:c-type cytochrome [Rhodospirillum sp. A1_3_36]|uniref:c-type cytochrome n=1 Tax=Rhodospirillum sp. A1_3_36 TaxID=3391666 RepID=UPI0039A4DBCB
MRIRLLFLFNLLASLLLGAGFAAADTVVETRQKLMVELIKATKIPRAMVQQGAPFDGAAVRAAVDRVLAVTPQLPSLFPDGSTTGSATRPALFENRADFEARLGALETAARAMAEAAGQGAEALPSAYGAYAAVCDSCHEVYRMPEEKDAHRGPPKE